MLEKQPNKTMNAEFWIVLLRVNLYLHSLLSKFSHLLSQKVRMTEVIYHNGMHDTVDKQI